MGNEAAIRAQSERLVKQKISQVITDVASVLAQSIHTEQYRGTQLVVAFSVVELSADLLQSLINCAAIALLSSSIRCRCLPVAICLLRDA